MKTLKSCAGYLSNRNMSRKNFPEVFYKKGPPACNLLKKGLRHRCFPINFSKFFESTYFVEHPRTAASVFDKPPKENTIIWTKLFIILIEITHF